MAGVVRTLLCLTAIVTVSVVVEIAAGGGGVALAAILGALAGQLGWARIIQRDEEPH